VIRRLATVAYGSIAVVCASSFGFIESKRSMWAATAQETAAGTVTEYRASVQRIISMARNSFSSFFIGYFKKKNEHLVLTRIHDALVRWGVHADRVWRNRAGLDCRRGCADLDQPASFVGIVRSSRDDG
jgi:hypothetical protein